MGLNNRGGNLRESPVEPYFLTSRARELLSNGDFLAYNLGVLLFKKMYRQREQLPNLEEVKSDTKIAAFWLLYKTRKLELNGDNYDVIRSVIASNGSYYPAVDEFKSEMEKFCRKKVLTEDEKESILRKNSVTGGVLFEYFISLHFRELGVDEQNKDDLGMVKKPEFLERALNYARILTQMKGECY
ncbi:MAG: hypothetical protein WC570_04905 [Patescibacteria group bacterium]